MEICYGPTNASAEALTFLLQSSPAIETLMIRSCGTWSSAGSWNWDLASVESCLHHLKNLYLYGFAGAADDVDFLRFVLKHAIVLESVNLRSKEIDVDENARNVVRGFRRASPKCVVRLQALNVPSLYL
ncbi:hypothetical protein M569_13623 [Genlisea aurea]|uniref:FBD domain-containing protein n=1 Tax=Genlisea aurea TaxID=192259 RepID=S8C2Y5_9LAMI|nr:hypothetical protein M569_13623 [Genlisea aurea]